MAQTTRLLDLIEPVHYELSLEVDIASFTFSAAEVINFALITPTDTLIFHASQLTITSAELPNGTEAAINYNSSDQTVTFKFSEVLTTGKHTLELKFSGAIRDDLHGFYRSHYVDEAGQTQWLATTQFEAIHAREAFVCIDEPSAKAIFELQITTQASFTVLANTRVIREIELSDGRVRRDFEPTPRMSTYLVAYVIGHLNSISTKSTHGVAVNAYAATTSVEDLRYALNIARDILDFYDEYFGIPYPLGKLDLVAIPDFASGAMENWGLVTYRETELMLDKHLASLANRQRVAVVVAHELAHQWFGNLVTMSWWNDLWLNEGFASWMEVLVIDKLFPEWQLWTGFISDHVARAMELDSLLNTHPIEVDVTDPRALDGIFDAVSYSKGAAIINQLNTYIGADAFRVGLQQYLNHYAYQNATTHDLWNALEQSSGEPIIEIMAAWTSQPGYPVVSFENGQLSQSRYLLNADPTTHQEIWPIPLSGLRDDLSITSRQLFQTQSAPAGREVAASLKLNPGQSGFYRVHYNEAMLEPLLPRLIDRSLPAPDRLGVVSDVIAAASAGYGSTLTLLELLSKMRHETDFAVWDVLTTGLMQIKSLFNNPDERDLIDSYILWYVQPTIERLGWEAAEGESYDDTILRPLALITAISSGSTQLIKKARSIFTSGADGELDAAADIRPAVYYGVAKTGTMSDWLQLLHMYETTTVAQERRRLLSALCRFESPEIIMKSLDLTFSDAVRSQDTISVLATCLVNPRGSRLAWDFTQSHWNELLDRYGDGGHMIEYLPGYVADAFSTEKDATEVETFFNSHPHPAITRPVAQALETIRHKAAWHERSSVEILEWLAHWQSSQPS